MVAELTDLNRNMMLSIDVIPIPTDEAVREEENRLRLTGTLCKVPVYRRTPLGRDICDLMLAVNRRYGRTDYLPCIAWGSLARRCAELAPGNRVELEGRLQSRVYTKRLGETSEERTAFEVSVSVLERLDAPAPAEQPCG